MNCLATEWCNSYLIKPDGAINRQSLPFHTLDPGKHQRKVHYVVVAQLTALDEQLG